MGLESETRLTRYMYTSRMTRSGAFHLDANRMKTEIEKVVSLSTER
jgi:hypothetical protein